MKICPILKFESRLISLNDLSSNTKEFRFSVPDDFDFIAGQFVMLESENSKGKPIKRAFSIASSPSQKQSIDLCIKILPDGRLSQPLSQLKPNDSVQLQGPYGKFVLQEEHNKKILFVAAGTGIAPLFSMINDLLEKGSTQPLTLVFGFHNPEDYLYQQELEELARRHKQFTLILVCSSPNESWKGEKGYVQDVLKRDFTDGSDYDAYLCGPPKMVSQTVALLLKQNFKKVYRESWG